MNTPARPFPASRSLTRLDDLVAAGMVAPSNAEALHPVTERYAVAVSPVMARLIGEGHNAIARQFVPDAREAETRTEERADPIGDHPHSPVKGLVHRYPDRVLVKLTHSCPVYCRFCFRREMVGPEGDGTLSEAELDAAFAYIAANRAICEVIFTGGDPLILPPRRIHALGERLSAIPHVRLVRWHSRVPVVLPERVTDELTSALAFAGKANYVAIHANHTDEFTPEATRAIARLADRGVVLLGQTVLLKGVNAETEMLASLFRRMAENRITPLYLHHPDLAPGTAHFRLSITEGLSIYRGLRGRISGHAIPAYVLDIPGGYGKVDLHEGNLREGATGLEVRDIAGEWHPYPG